jgi:hypothetical protein
VLEKSVLRVFGVGGAEKCFLAMVFWMSTTDFDESID